jgi:hypothetical protein
MKVRIVLIAVFAILLLNSAIEISIADPIVNYRQGSNGRAEWVHAVIHPSDLNTGEPTSTNSKMAAQVRALGKSGDDAGHIVANILGGKMRLYNLFPQNLNKNRGEYKNTVESHIKDFLVKYNTAKDYVDFDVNLVYSSAQDTRPTGLNFVAKFYHNGKIANSTDIPVFGQHRVPANPYRGLIQNP